MVLLGNEKSIDGTPIKLIDEGQRCHATVRRVNARITNNGLSSILQDAA